MSHHPAGPPEAAQPHSKHGEASQSAAARSAILGRLRAASIPSAPALPDVKAWFDTHRRDESLAQRIQRLRSALEAAKAEVHDTTAVDWPEVLQRIAKAKGLRRLMIGVDTPHGRELEARRPVELQLQHYPQGDEAWRDILFDEVDASFTVARSAIAETGTLVLWPDASEPRLMSLVPPVHMVMLDAATIHADLHAAMLAEHWAGGLPTNVVLISGPSKTADIQQTTAYGAHGPRELVVLLRHAQGAGL